MRKRRLRSFVLPTLYLMVLGVMAFGITMLSKNLMNKKVANDDYYNYSMSVFNESEEDTPVMEEPQEVSTKATAPFDSYSVGVEKEFYSKDDSQELQETSLIYYEGTYMPNTGILYSSAEEFNVLAILDGKVKEIKEDEILGNMLTIEHDNNLTSIYYTLGEIQVKEGDTIKQGDILAKSGSSKLQTSNPYTLLLETYQEGKLVNPNSIFEKKES